MEEMHTFTRFQYGSSTQEKTIFLTSLTSLIRSHDIIYCGWYWV